MDHDAALPFVVLLGLVLVWWSTVGLDRRLRTIERNVTALLRHFNIDTDAIAQPSDAVKLLAADPGRKVEAMRLYRQETGADLKAAKAIVEALTRGN